SRSSVVTTAQYKKQVVARMSTNADAVYQMVSRAANDQRRAGLAAVVEDITDSADGLKKFLIVGIIDLGSQSTNMNIDKIRAAIVFHVPNLARDHVTRYRFALMPGQ